MEILIVQNEQLSGYVTKTREYLESQGYSVTVVDIADYNGNVPVNTVPSFLITKAGKEGYTMRGKQPLDIILNWARNSGAGKD
jgi:hypothetical protein